MQAHYTASLSSLFLSPSVLPFSRTPCLLVLLFTQDLCPCANSFVVCPLASRTSSNNTTTSRRDLKYDRAEKDQSASHNNNNS